MVLKRPQKAEKPEASCSDSDLQLMEHLVKKSLDVNPGLRAGRSTQEVLQNLRKEAVDPASAGAAAQARPKASVSEKRRKTMEFFLEQKAEEYRESADSIMIRMKALEHELTGVRETTVDELIDFSLSSPVAQTAPRPVKFCGNIATYSKSWGSATTIYCEQPPAAVDSNPPIKKRGRSRAIFILIWEADAIRPKTAPASELERGD